MLRADPEDEDGLDTVDRMGTCVVSTGRAAQLHAVHLGLALGCLSRRQGCCRQHRAVQGSPKSSLLSSSPVNAAIVIALEH